MNMRLKKNGFYECADALCVVKSAVFPMRRRERRNFKNAKRQEIYEIVKEAQALAIAAVMPGKKAREIDAVARDFIAAQGYSEAFFHSTGHGVGIDIHELPFISKRGDTVLKEGMVFSVEPGIYLPGEFGVRIQDVVVVRENGAEIL